MLEFLRAIVAVLIVVSIAVAVPFAGGIIGIFLAVAAIFFIFKVANTEIDDV